VPLGKTKSIVDRFEKRESSSIDCSPPTGSRGDRTVRVDSPPTSSVRTHVFFLMWLTSRFL
jgi:katanin p80 WD40 repeat-containing subunit B1